MLKTVVLEGWPDCREETPIVIRGYWAIRDEISVQDGVLFRSQRVIIPKTLRPEMLRRIHYSHIGGEACYRQARDTLFWPNMQGEIKDFVQQCSVCNEYARTTEGDHDVTPTTHTSLADSEHGPVQPCRKGFPARGGPLL